MHIILSKLASGKHTFWLISLGNLIYPKCWLDISNNISNIMDKWMNKFSQKFQDSSDMTQDRMGNIG